MSTTTYKRLANTKEGDVLTSTGDDGTVRFWMRDLDGEWCERCEVRPDDALAPRQVIKDNATSAAAIVAS